LVAMAQAVGFKGLARFAFLAVLAFKKF